MLEERAKQSRVTLDNFIRNPTTLGKRKEGIIARVHEAIASRIYAMDFRDKHPHIPWKKMIGIPH